MSWSTRLGDERPVSARGVLLARGLLRDPASPLYSDDAERLLARRNRRNLVHRQVLEIDHRLDEPLELFRLGGRERDVVRMRADGAALVIVGVGVEDLARGGAAPVAAAGRLARSHVRDAGGRRWTERDRDRLRREVQQLLEGHMDSLYASRALRQGLT